MQSPEEILSANVLVRTRQHEMSIATIYQSNFHQPTHRDVNCVVVIVAVSRVTFAYVFFGIVKLNDLQQIRVDDMVKSIFRYWFAIKNDQNRRGGI